MITREKEAIIDDLPQFSQHGNPNELINYLSPIYTNIKEIKAILDVVWDEVKKLIENKNIQSQNYFIQTCDLETLIKFENLCGLSNGDNKPIEMRRFEVLSIFSMLLPYSLPKLKEILNSLCGVGNWRLSIDYEKQAMSIEILESFDNMVETLQTMLIPVIPCHIEWLIHKDMIIESEDIGYYVGGYVDNLIELDIYDDRLGRNINIENEAGINRIGIVAERINYEIKEDIE